MNILTLSSQLKDCTLFVLVLLCFCIFPETHAQSFQWFRDIRIDPSNFAYEQGFDILPDSTGAFVIVGVANDRAMIARCSSQGDIIWSHKYSSAESNRFTRVCRTMDNGFIAIGTFYFYDPNANGDCLYAKYTTDGELLWSKSFGWAGEDALSDMVVLPNNNMVLLGTSESVNRKCIVSCITTNGDTLWVKSYSTMNNSFGRKLLPLPNGNLLAINNSYGSSTYGTWLFEIAQDGRTISTGTIHVSDTSFFLTDAVLVGENLIVSIGFIEDSLGEHISCIVIFDRQTGLIQKTILFPNNVDLSEITSSTTNVYVTGRSISWAPVADTTWVKCFDNLVLEQWTIKSEIDTSYREITSLRITSNGNLIGTGWVTVNNGMQKHAIATSILTSNSSIHSQFSNRQSSHGRYQSNAGYNLLGRKVSELNRIPWLFHVGINHNGIVIGDVIRR